LEEADESLYWLEILAETQIVKPELVAPLLKEANELVAILVASLNTARNNQR
jgi:four helix bundle protein